MIKTASLLVCAADEITSTDLANAIEDEQDVSFETYRTISEDSAERGNLIFDPRSGRGAIAWGSDAIWTDADSADDVLRRWLEDDIIN